MQYSSITALLTLACTATTIALPEPLTASFNGTSDGTSLNAVEEKKASKPPNLIYNQNPPKGQCRISSFIDKINHNVGWRVTTSDGTFISTGGCYRASLCTSPLLGLGDDLAVATVNNEAWQYIFMRSGSVSGDRMLSTDTKRCTMNPPNPKGDNSVTVTCDFDCGLVWDPLLGGDSKGKGAVVTTDEASKAEVANDLTLPEGLVAPTR